MQLTLTFTRDYGIPIMLPLASSWMLQGLLYEALSYDSAYSEFIHDYGFADGNRRFKLFCFSELQTAGRYALFQRETKMIAYLSDVTLLVRSNQPHFIEVLFTYFSRNRSVWLGDNLVYVRAQLEDERIYTDHIRVRTLSPITVYRSEEDRHTTYYSPTQPQFYEAIIAGAKRKWRSFYGTEDGFALNIAPVEDCRFICRKTRFKQTFITAWHGQFDLCGNAQTLDFLYSTGIGSKNSEGFGMLELLK